MNFIKQQLLIAVVWTAAICGVVICLGVANSEPKLQESEKPCKHENIVYKADPVILERKVGAVARVNYRTFCNDCGFEIIELPDIETEDFIMKDCRMVVDPNEDFSVEI